MYRWLAANALRQPQLPSPLRSILTLGRFSISRAEHNWQNAGEVAHTSKFRPWRIKTAVAFTDRQRAGEFERYLKTASGRAFAKKRL